jgi:hypothetical protein
MTLEARWKSDLQGAGEAYHRHNADRGRPPTAKQFAGMAAAAATNWFAGDLTAVYNVLGLRSPLPATTYRRSVPEDPRAFTKRLREALRAGSVADASTKDDVRFTNSVQSIAQHGLAWLAEMEALGKPPELAQFSKRHYFKQNFDVLAPARDDAWRIYCDAIQRVLDEPPDMQSAPALPRVYMSRPEPRSSEPADARAVEPDASANAAGTDERRGLLKRLLGRS